MNTVPIFEAKNKLPLFMHQAETSGPVFISRRNKTVGVLISFEEYKKLSAANHNETFLDKAANLRKKINGLLTNEDVEKIFARSNEPADTYQSDVFDEVVKG